MSLSQSPLVLVPKEVALKTVAKEIRSWPNQVLSERMASEFLKSASIVQKPPWEHLRASAWLRQWVHANLARTSSSPESTSSLSWALDWSTDRAAGASISTDPLGWHRYAPFEVVVRRVAVILENHPRLKRRAELPPDLPLDDDIGPVAHRGGALYSQITNQQ